MISGVVIRSDLDNAGVPTTAAVYQVDKFSIIAPGDPSATARSPFVYYSTPQVIDGVTYPPALYSKDAIIQTARVGTLQIAGNAVTVPARVTRPGVVEMTSVSTWEVLASLAMNRKGYATDLSFSATLDGFGSGVLEFGFFRDGVLLNKRHHATAPMGRQTQVSATFTDFDEGTGPTVFQIKGRRATPGVTGGWDANLRVFNRHLAAWQFQR
ncbi:hypothetical protein [Aestuariivita sp.]|uniref:hypothetical protein n=1 Tax=Aestuariivita sp. TaxID=1872407 RepID=UPI00217148F3|nr:hypothetical protein [Aestuariivita sp.]MCE8006554.1 hypothetical protein [Aestuariivita sp.]